MSASNERLRPPPSERFAGPEHKLDFGASLARLRQEPHPSKDGHSQVTLFHSETLRLVLFAFEAGAGLPRHSAPGVVLIQPLRGEVHVSTASERYELRTGQSLVLQPGVPHDVDAPAGADVLLSIAMAGGEGGRRPGAAE